MWMHKTLGPVGVQNTWAVEKGFRENVSAGFGARWAVMESTLVC
jgi:hypothetical protein